MITYQEANFRRTYEIAPIILVGGLAQNLPNGMMTILSLTEGSEIYYSNPNQYFAHFKPMSGSTLEDWGIAEYPFASMSMAANAVVQNPLSISLQMICPAQNSGGYPLKNSIVSQIKAALDVHILNGGTFTVATPAYTYINCLLKSLRDVSGSESKQVQLSYQWDFVQPLITEAAATSTYNNLYTKLANGLPVTAPVQNYGVSQSIGNSANNQPPQTP